MSDGKRPSLGASTFTATLTLEETGARKVAARIGEDDILDSLPVDVAEAADGRWEVIVYFEERPDRRTEVRLTGVAIVALGHEPPAFVVRELPETDWVAKSLAGLAPVRAGRFLVHGAHDRDKRRPNDTAIEIDAGQAFGTGHHGSTVGCLLAIDALAKSRRVANALDIGTGSGVLAIALAKACKARVLASDIDPVAVTVARDNIRCNRAAGAVQTIVAAGLAGRAFGERAPFDLIVANILAGPLVGLAPAIRRHLAPGGIAILSGLIRSQRARMVATYRGQGLRLAREIVRGDWLTLVFVRPARRRAQSG